MVPPAPMLDIDRPGAKLTLRSFVGFALKWGEGHEGEGWRHESHPARSISGAITPGQDPAVPSGRSRSTDVVWLSEVSSPLG